MNSVVPMGGWYRPIERLTIIMIPSCTVSMPTAEASGTNIGVSSSTAAGRSMNMPVASMIRFIARMISQGDCSVSLAKRVNSAGSCS